MKRRYFTRSTQASSERGYAMLAILLALMLMLLAMAVSAPVIAQQIKRDREEEMIRRGRQYVRAIQRYVRKFGRYPAKMEDLENTNNLRFLRRRYKDPMTESGEWRIIHFGEARPRAGQPFGGGQAQAGQAVLPGARPAGGTSEQPGSATRPAGRPAGDSLSGRRFGGGPIVGVASKSEEESIRELDGKNHYNEWEFVYDVSQDPGARPPVQPGQTAQPGRPGQPGKPSTPTPGTQPQGRPLQPTLPPDK
ncbi:MAG TPA: hypothetical protein VLE48_06100 [Terriglobales bacterium]|nr:hypothetical protein [Terriglobales bacterium]